MSSVDGNLVLTLTAVYPDFSLTPRMTGKFMAAINLDDPGTAYAVIEKRMSFDGVPDYYPDFVSDGREDMLYAV